MTTAFALAADGRFLASAQSQPMGFALAVGTASVAVVGSYSAATGSRLLKTLSDSLRSRFWWTAAIVAILAWGYKILVFRGFL